MVNEKLIEFGKRGVIMFDKKNVKLVYESDGIRIYKATRENEFYKDPKIQTYSRSLKKRPAKSSVSSPAKS